MTTAERTARDPSGLPARSLSPRHILSAVGAAAGVVAVAFICLLAYSAKLKASPEIARV